MPKNKRREKAPVVFGGLSNNSKNEKPNKTFRTSEHSALVSRSNYDAALAQMLYQFSAADEKQELHDFSVSPTILPDELVLTFKTRKD